MDSIASIVDVVMTGFFSDSRNTDVNDKKRTVSKVERIRSNEMEYATRSPSYRPVLLAPHRFMTPWYNYNYNMNNNARPSAVQQYQSLKNNGNVREHMEPSTGSLHTTNTLENHNQSKDQLARKSRSTNEPSANEIVVNGHADDFSNFETILLEGLGIDPKSIEKWTPVYCAKEYVIDVMKRAAQSYLFI